MEEQKLDIKSLLIIAMLFYGLYSYTKNSSKPDVEDDIKSSYYASQVMPRLVKFSAAAYKQALEELKPGDTEASFNANLSKLQRAATDLAYKPLDESLNKAFNPPGSEKSVWTPDKAKEVYSAILADLLTLEAKLNRANIKAE